MRSKEFSFQGPSINIWVAGLCPLLLVITKHVDHDVGDVGDADEDGADSFVSISETLITACLRLFLITTSKIDRNYDDEKWQFCWSAVLSNIFKKGLRLTHNCWKSLPLIEWNRQTGGDVDSRYNDGANDDDSDVDNDDEEEFVSISV